MVKAETDKTDAEALAYRLRQQKLVSDFGLFALRSHVLNDVFREATRVAASGLDAKFSKLLRYIPEDHSLLVVAGVGWDGDVVGKATLGADTESPAGYAFQSGQSVVSNHLSEEGRFRTPTLLSDHDVTRAINVPIRNGDIALGVLEVDSPDTARFTQEDTAFLQSLANIISVAYERWQARRDRDLLDQEQKHRIKNLFAVAGALLRLSEREAARDGGSPFEIARQRLSALSRACDISMGDVSEVEGLTDAAQLTREILAPYMGEIRVRSDEVELSADDVPPLALMLHEFATNAVKYGSLSREDGSIDIEWTQASGLTHLIWTEHGVTMKSDATQRSGFGSTLIDTVSAQLRADVTREWRDDGLRIAVCFPVDRILKNGGTGRTSPSD
ncbi:sensor histidine kinase [Chachezhania antarctica]|uniref:sensor histidine kinase n=1 Tax=Chachezhania antarctica TaxID=2340860 RepID=UPI000EAB55AD|nr:GAF domain-containing protein [Chachezhania antarctica]|tara:strand:+ start:4723 stop:5886 length:1164 start_codon:yes stop_codon:yes gene_type:complete